MTKVLRAFGAFLADVLEVVVLASAIFVILYLFVAQPHEVSGNSMLDNFHDGEYVLTDKVTYRFREPERGDVVIFKYPKQPELDYIKRIVGLPGDEVMLQGDQVFVYNAEHPEGVKLEEDFLRPGVVTEEGSYLLEGQKVKVREGEYLVLGDNRPQSSDSRDWGPVPEDLLIGRAWLRYWPPNKFSLIYGYEYR